MKRTMGSAALLAAVMAIAPMQAHAQVGPRGQRPAAAAPRGQRPAAAALPGAGVEMILRQKERLELTDAQVKQLDQIREQVVQRRVARQAEAAELRSKVLAGEMEASALRERMQARRDSAEKIQEQQRQRIEAVLTDAQKQTLQQWAGQARAFQMGRRSMMRPGLGMGQRFQPGFAPRTRQRIMPGPMGRGRRGPGIGMGMGSAPPPDSIR